jgi:predicted DNA-binding protein YlxM (UPF0122 family)
MKNQYYVYGLYDPAESFPFYIGKGNGNRMNEHFTESYKGANSHKDNKIAKIKREGRNPYAEKLYDNLTEEQAYMREWALINVHFPKLTNIKKSYGEGYAMNGEENPMYGKKRDEEIKSKIAKKLKGKNYGEDIGNSKLTNKQVREIKWLLDENVVHQQIANKYGVSKPAIVKISTGEYWSYIKERKKPTHLDLENLRKDQSNKIRDEVAKRMRWLAESQRYTLKQIGKHFGRHRDAVRNASQRVDEVIEPEEKPEDRKKVKEALEIKAAVKISNKTYKELAEIYGCCKNHIYNVVNGHSFGFLPKEPDEKYYEAAQTRINNINQ